MTAAAATALRRALLYVPGSSNRLVEKAKTLTVDCVTYDLEDSVLVSEKNNARVRVVNALKDPRPENVGETAVRINSFGSGLAEKDLTAVLHKSAHLDTIVIPKVNSASDLRLVTDFLDHSPHKYASSIKVLALIESARAVMDIKSICAASPRLDGLIFSAEDFALDLNIKRTPSLQEFAYAQQMIVTAARAYELRSAIDLVATVYKKNKKNQPWIQILKGECIRGLQLGFTGKQCIHPDQIKLVQEQFGPNLNKVRNSVKFLVAAKKAAKMGKGAWGYGGKMVDAPVIAMHRAEVERGRIAGWAKEIKEFEKTYKDVEPE